MIISLRNQGRLREALAIAERIVRANGVDPVGFSTPQSLNAVSVAQVQFEMGHFSTAAESEFRQARISAVDGYSRVSLELGRTFVAEGRPRDAIEVFLAPLHGSLEASNYYLTQTDLHAALGDAFDRAGESDSALVHYRRVLSAWRGADPEFNQRIAAIRTRVAAIEGGR